MENKFIHVLGAFYDLAFGDHPSLATNPKLFTIPAFTTPAQLEKIEELELPVMACTDGHNLMADGTYAEAAGMDLKVPLSPLFAKDLAGRVIYLGYGPEIKKAEYWAADPRLTFPAGCRDITADIPGSELLESTFLTRFRTLDMSFAATTMPSGHTDLTYAAFYPNANLYPYKLRLDTFYADGWKLPQTQMLYARPERPAVAELAAAELMKKWQTRSKGQPYEQFHESVGGADYFESLFLRGCTLIPTFEACNGYNKVSSTFDLEDFWPGRAVNGLHEVVSTKPDNAPRGTILEVLEPGYVCAHLIKPAKVVASDGSGYVSPHAQDPAPLAPDLRLPHQRTIANWWATWLPTHPAHFEPPALWGWDLQTGRFLQLFGPVWDPLHYYYDCVPKVIRAYREPLRDNPLLAPVPENMKLKFHPIVPMEGFDTISASTRARREEEGIMPLSGIDRVRDTATSCGVGYHPLPAALEYELDNWWFPELDPRRRLNDELPTEIQERLCPVISCKTSPLNYIATVRAPEGAQWMTDKNIMHATTGNALEDYIHLGRYFGDGDDELIFSVAPVFLAHMPEKEILMTAQEQMGGADVMEKLQELSPHVYDALFDFRDQSHKWRRMRHRIFRRHPGWYALGWWENLPPAELDMLVKQLGTKNRAEGEQALRRGVPSDNENVAEDDEL